MLLFLAAPSLLYLVLGSYFRQWQQVMTWWPKVLRPPFPKLIDSTCRTEDNHRVHQLLALGDEQFAILPRLPHIWSKMNPIRGKRQILHSGKLWTIPIGEWSDWPVTCGVAVAFQPPGTAVLKPLEGKTHFRFWKKKKRKKNNVRNETVLLLPKMLLEETQGLSSKPLMSLTVGPMEMTAVTEADSLNALWDSHKAARTWSPCSPLSQRSHRKPQSKRGHGTCGSARF